jgi:hypothetical protein
VAKLFLGAIIGFNLGEREARSNAGGLFGTYYEEQKLVQLSAAEVTKLHRRFNQLERNRLDFVMWQRKEKQMARISSHGPNKEQFFKPRINEKSSQMANKIRPPNKNKAYMYEQGQEYEKRKLEKAREKAKLDQKAQDEIQECTF